MSYEHDHISGNRMSYEHRDRIGTGQGGSTGLWLVLGGVVLAILLAVFVLGGNGSGTAPEGLGGPATMPAAPPAVQPDTPAPALPGVIPVVPAPAD